MRFGILLPDGGPLATPAAVHATVRAAEELGYASVWSRSVPRLVALDRSSTTVPLTLLLDGPGPARSTQRARPLAAVLARAAGAPDRLAAVRGVLPAADLLDTTATAPLSDLVAGWAPLGAGPPGPARPARPPGAGDPERGGVLVLRLGHPPTPGELAAAVAAAVDEVVVDLPAAAGLDDLLAGFADAADRVAAVGQPAR